MPGIQAPSSSSSRIRARPPPSAASASPQPSAHQRRTIFASNVHANAAPSPSTPSTLHSRPLESVVIRTNNDNDSTSLSTPIKSPHKSNNGSNGGNNNNDNINNVKPTNVQVCVRLRPMLASDFKHNAIEPSAANVLPTLTPTKKGGKGYARETTSTYRHMIATPSKKGVRKMHASGLKTPGTPSDSSKQPQQQQSQQQQPSQLQPSWTTHPSDTKRITQASHTTSHTQHHNPERLADYTFDRVYSPEEATGTLYQKSIRGVVNSVVEGFHGSVFAYGQTSSGKTHTMTGSRHEAGVVRLAVQDVFHRIQSQSTSNAPREYLVRVSYLEIYNEQIYDLLAMQQQQQSGSSQLKGSLQHHHLPPSTAVRIFESRTEGVVIRGLREEIVTCPEEVFALLDSGDAKRKTGSTGMNKTSSRSHSVFRLVLESRASANTGGGSSKNGGVPPLVPSSNSSLNSDTDSVTTGRSSAKGPVRISSLSLVDLAGSESAKATGATGVRQKEGQYINKSLLTLGHVVCKLSEIGEREAKSSASGPAAKEHIPYRDSKLTRLLQPSLGGNAQVCIICNISPALSNLEESHNTLKFAMRAKKIKQNAKITEVKDEKTLLSSYRQEIEELKRQLKEAQKAATEAVQMSQQQSVRKNRKNDTQEELSSDEEDQDDAHVLVSAIANLESLILKAGVNKSTRKVNGAIGSAAEVGLDDSSTPTSRALDVELRNAASSEDLPSEMVTEVSSPATSTINKSALTTPTHDGDSEDDGVLLEELHRIQGMLGTVMKQKKRIKSGKPTLSAQYATPERDAEVELLRSQLQEQSVASTMRQADSSFLQSQLNEKEGILKEVSVLLEALEKRQLELESENKQLHGDLAKAANMIEEGEAQRKVLEEKLQEKDVQLEEKKDVVFVEHGK